jgi:adenine deaminase
MINAKGKYITPGLIDPHIHLYHAQLNMTQMAKALLLHGTTTVAEGFYAAGIVSGVHGIQFCLEEIKATPLKIVFLIPALAYYQTQDLGLPKTPKAPSFEEFRDMLHWRDCHGIEELPYTPILNQKRDATNLADMAISRGKIITGHASGLGGGKLNAYLAIGASSDHECTSEEEALERVRLGMRVIMRQGSAAKDVTRVVKGLTENKIDARYFSFCADVASTLKIIRQGHIDHCIRVAISQGLNPLVAVQAATLNAAETLNMDHEIGSIAPGKIADILLLNDLPTFNISAVIASGNIMVRDSKFLVELESPEYPKFMYNTVRLPRNITPKDFEIKAPKGTKQVTVRVIGVRDGTLITEDRRATLTVKDGLLQPDIEGDILKIAMIDRFHLSGRIGKGFVQGFKLRAGAIGTTYTPTTENLLIIGANDRDMAVATNKIAEMGGGHIVVNGGSVLAQMALPLFGLLSDQSLETAIQQQTELYKVIEQMGCDFIDPLSTLAFLGAAPEIGTLKITEKGLVNVPKNKFESLTVD